MRAQHRVSGALTSRRQKNYKIKKYIKLCVHNIGYQVRSSRRQKSSFVSILLSILSGIWIEKMVAQCRLSSP